MGFSQKSSYQLVSNIPYTIDSTEKQSDYTREKCILDIYYPSTLSNFPTIVWIHGGGLTGGEKYIPERLKQQGFAVVAINYRLHPDVKYPKYIEDTAAAIAWVFNHIKDYGGNPDKIFISGHSAGGYLASMVSLEKKWLAIHKIDANKIAGVIPFSGHTITHFTIRAEEGIPRNQPVIDEFAPLYHIRKDAPPFLLITGDRALELPGRYEENAYFEVMMKNVGHKHIRLYEIEGYDHNMTEAGYPLLINFVKKTVKKQN